MIPTFADRTAESVGAASKYPAAHPPFQRVRQARNPNGSLDTVSASSERLFPQSLWGKWRFPAVLGEGHGIPKDAVPRPSGAKDAVDFEWGKCFGRETGQKRQDRLCQRFFGRSGRVFGQFCDVFGPSAAGAR